MNTKPVWYVIAEQDRTVTQYSVYNLIDVIASDLANFDQVYQERIAPLANNTGIYRHVTCFIFNREPPEFIMGVFRQVQVGRTEQGKTAAMHRQIKEAQDQGYKVEVLETKEVDQDQEVPYHEQVWND